MTPRTFRAHSLVLAMFYDECTWLSDGPRTSSASPFRQRVGVVRGGVLEAESIGISSGSRSPHVCHVCAELGGERADAAAVAAEGDGGEGRQRQAEARRGRGERAHRGDELGRHAGVEQRRVAPRRRPRPRPGGARAAGAEAAAAVAADAGRVARRPHDLAAHPPLARPPVLEPRLHLARVHAQLRRELLPNLGRGERLHRVDLLQHDEGRRVDLSRDGGG